jgi:hypothetical protein
MYYRISIFTLHYTTSCITQSSAPEDGQNGCPKHDELIGIINKLLLLHLVGYLHYSLFIEIFCCVNLFRYHLMVRRYWSRNFEQLLRNPVRLQGTFNITYSALL